MFLVRLSQGPDDIHVVEAVNLGMELREGLLRGPTAKHRDDRENT